MTTIKIDDVEYSVPESWEEITLRQFIKYMDLLHSGKSHFHTLYQVSAFCDIPYDLVKIMKPKFISKFLDALSFLVEQPVLPPVKEFSFNKETYSIMNSFITSEAQDFLSAVAIERNNEKHPHRGIPMKIALLARKKIVSDTSTGYESLDDYDIEARAEEFLQLPMMLAKQLDGFFLSYSMMFSPDFHSLILNAKNLQIQNEIELYQSILKKSAGMPLYSKLLTMIFCKYLSFIKQRWNRYYTSILSKEKSKI